MPRKDYRFICKTRGCCNSHGRDVPGKHLCPECEKRLADMRFRLALQCGVNPLKILTVLLAFVVLFVGANAARASRPTPPSPYPEPGAEVLPMGDPYPPPAQPTSVPQPWQLPTADCPAVPPSGKPCAWGLFPDSVGNYRGWVSLDGPLNFGLTGTFCIMSGAIAGCYDLTPHSYDGTRQRNWYKTGIFVVSYLGCREWHVYYASLGDQAADIRLPNAYIIYCLYGPFFQG